MFFLNGSRKFALPATANRTKAVLEDSARSRHQRDSACSMKRPVKERAFFLRETDAIHGEEGLRFQRFLGAANDRKRPCLA